MYEEVQPVSPRVLSFVEKSSRHKKKTLTPPKLDAKTTVLVINLRIACIDTLSQNFMVWSSGGCWCQEMA